MKCIKSVGKFYIYELNAKEVKEFDFRFAPVTKETVECYGSVDPRDSDLDCEYLEDAISHALSASKYL